MCSPALVRAGLERAGWTFKGGTCLRHCYYPGYRFSEDIDFSCRPRGDNLASALSLLEQAAGLVADDTGVAIDVREAVHSPGQEQIENPAPLLARRCSAAGTPGRQGSSHLR